MRAWAPTSRSTKPRIIELLLVTTVPAMMLAAGGWPSLSLLLFTLVGGTLAAGAANVFNCYFDRDIDRLMHRTQKRPLPMGVISPRAALVFGAVLTVSSIALLAATTTLLAAALAAGAIFYYAVLYTMVFKRHTRRSTECGGVPGAAPVLIGWAAVTGLARLAGRGGLRRRLLLADAALLGAGAAVQGRLRAGRRPDAAGGHLRAVGRPPVRRLGVADRRRLAAALAGRRRTTASASATRSRRPRWAPGSSWRRTACCAGSSGGGETKPMQLFHVSISYLALLSVAIIVDAIV